MARLFRVLVVTLGVCVVLGGCLPFATGCKSQDSTMLALATLQEGKARGHISLTTGGAFSAGQQTEFFLGARNTHFAFDGDINFAEADFDLEELKGPPATNEEDDEPPD